MGPRDVSSSRGRAEVSVDIDRKGTENGGRKT